MTEATCKAPVSALQEYLMQKGHAPPTYEFGEITEDGVKSFQCFVTALNEIADGVGRSRREAKHEAADNMLKKFQETDTSVRYKPQAQMPAIDAIMELRFLCTQRNYPSPQFEIIEVVGPPVPEFTCKCSIASIVRYGTSSTKKWARQLASQAMIDIIQNIPVVDNVAELIKYQEADSKYKFKVYKELIESDSKDRPGVLLSERHNFFKNMQPDVKAKASAILNNPTSYMSAENQVDLVTKALGIRYKKSAMNTGTNLLLVELVCEFDVVFIGHHDEAFCEMLDYFKVMLV